MSSWRAAVAAILPALASAPIPDLRRNIPSRRLPGPSGRPDRPATTVRVEFLQLELEQALLCTRTQLTLVDPGATPLFDSEPDTLRQPSNPMCNPIGDATNGNLRGKKGIKSDFV